MDIAPAVHFVLSVVAGDMTWKVVQTCKSKVRIRTVSAFHEEAAHRFGSFYRYSL